MSTYKVKDCHPRNHYKHHDSFYSGYTHKEEEILKNGIITAEKAYRRGVGQTLAMLSYLPDGTLNKKLLERMAYKAIEIRAGKKAHPALLHEMFEDFELLRLIE